MHRYETLKHTRWECKYHVAFIPKYQRKALYVQLRWDLGPVFRDLAEQKECKVEESHLMPDAVRMLLKRAAEVVGIQGDGVQQRQERHSHRSGVSWETNLVGQHFRARGYWVSTVGKNEASVRRYIQEQEKEDRRLQQLEISAL